MPIKLYCDVCGEEIPEKAGEIYETGDLHLLYGLWGEPTEQYFNTDLLCEKCTLAIKKAIDDKIKELKEAAKS